ncbi:DUF354 domain-containing protein [bacterium]|nr:DUF354 domain-containing protein [bacterium]
MRVLFDIAHPAHVHFFKNIIWALQKDGHDTAVVARDKEVTHDLLDHYGFEYTTTGHSARRGLLGHAMEMVVRDWALLRVARRFGPHVILARNPCGVQVARLVGAVGIFDSDDGISSSGIHFRAAKPFAHIITTPDCLAEQHGAKHIKYPGYKQSAYLHPNQFTPSPDVLQSLGVSEGEDFFIVRFVALAASHDIGESGLDADTAAHVIGRLQERGRVFITSEGPIPAPWADLRLDLPIHRLHDALAHATLVVGDSQTVAAEAAYLGTPSLRYSTYAGRVCYLQEMQHRYGLCWNYRPEQRAELYAKLDELLAESDLAGRFAAARQRMLADKCDVTRWMCAAIEVCAGGRRGVAQRLAEAAPSIAERAR